MTSIEEEGKTPQKILFDLNLIYAHCSPDFGIGYKGNLPWPMLRRELQHFRLITTYNQTPGRPNAVLMGRKSYDGIPAANCPLRGRINVVVTSKVESNTQVGETVFFCPSYSEAIFLLNHLYQEEKIEKVFAIGGTSCFEFIAQHYLAACKAIFVTHIVHNFPCDTFLPRSLHKPRGFYAPRAPETHSENGITYLIYRYLLLEK